MTEGSDLDTRRAHVQDEHADALVLGYVGGGADVAKALVGVHGIGGPHLLTVDNELIAVENGPRRKRAEVGPGVGLAHADAPNGVAADSRGRPRPLRVGTEI